MKHLIALCLLSLVSASLLAQGSWQFWLTGGATVSLPTTVNSANQMVRPLVETDNTPDSTSPTSAGRQKGSGVGRAG